MCGGRQKKEGQCRGEKTCRSRSLCGSSILGNENVQEQCALRILLGPGTVFRGQGSCLGRQTFVMRGGERSCFCFYSRASIGENTLLAPGSVGPIWTGFPGVPPTSTPTPAPAWQEPTYLMGWTEPCWWFPFLGSFPPTFIFFLKKTYTLLLTAVNYNLSEKKKKLLKSFWKA